MVSKASLIQGFADMCYIIFAIDTSRLGQASGKLSLAGIRLHARQKIGSKNNITYYFVRRTLKLERSAVGAVTR